MTWFDFFTQGATRMRRLAFLCFSPLLCALVLSSSAAAQLPPANPKPLNPLQAPQGPPGCSTTQPSSCEQAAEKILPMVMGASPLESNLRRLTDEGGGRVTGTPAMKRAVEWGVAAFRAAGVDVHTEKYTMPVTWAEGATHLEVLAPMPLPVHLVAEGWSPATPPGGIEADLVDAGDRKSTRLNSSHGYISYAVFCLKKK